MTASVDPLTATLLAHKGSPVPLEPAYGTFHNATPVDPSHQHQGSVTGGAHQYERGPNFPTLATDPLRPLYTERLAISPRYPTLEEASRRRHTFWSTVIARGALALMVSAGVGAFWLDTGIFPAGAFVAGLIIFIAACFYSGCRNRTSR